MRLQRGAQETRAALPGQDRQAAFQRATAALRKVLQQQALAQHGVGGLGQRMTLARAQRAVVAEEGGNDAVGGLVELQHGAQQLDAEVDKGVGMHGADYPAHP